jgi:hypothetical protein
MKKTDLAELQRRVEQTQRLLLSATDLPTRARLTKLAHELKDEVLEAIARSNEQL